ncbi:MAG TPA: OmpA family protein [Polyangiaceae bacterium]
MADYDEYGLPKRRRGGWLGWLLFILVLGLAGAFVYYLYLPLRQTRAGLEADLARAKDRERAAADRSKKADERYASLQQDLTKVSGELQQTVAEKEKIESELKGLQNELTKKLEPEIKEGNVRLRRRGQDLVLDMADQILFDVGKAEVNDQGKRVLAGVADSVRALPYSLQVAGHTDSARITSPEIQERFPTNWELSTARATNVVRFLQERGKIPGSRLGASGFAEFRPAGSNATEEGRQKNRRIEVLLQPRKTEETGAKSP